MENKHSLYIITDPFRAHRSIFKIGITENGIEKIITRYQTALENPILLGFFTPVGEETDARKVEKLMKDTYTSVRKKHGSGRESEWFQLPWNTLVLLVKSIMMGIGVIDPHPSHLVVAKEDRSWKIEELMEIPEWCKNKIVTRPLDIAEWEPEITDLLGLRRPLISKQVVNTSASDIKSIIQPPGNPAEETSLDRIGKFIAGSPDYDGIETIVDEKLGLYRNEVSGLIVFRGGSGSNSQLGKWSGEKYTAVTGIISNGIKRELFPDERSLIRDNGGRLYLIEDLTRVEISPGVFCLEPPGIETRDKAAIERARERLILGSKLLMTDITMKGLMGLASLLGISIKDCRYKEDYLNKINQWTENKDSFQPISKGVERLIKVIDQNRHIDYRDATTDDMKQIIKLFNIPLGICKVKQDYVSYINRWIDERGSKRNDGVSTPMGNSVETVDNAIVAAVKCTIPNSELSQNLLQSLIDDQWRRKKIEELKKKQFRNRN